MGTRRAADDQIVVGADPVANDKLHEQRPVDPTTTAVTDVFRDRLVADFGEPQPGGQVAIVTEAAFPAEQQ